MEHKKFFVKDFIQYASPCFGCGKPMSLRLVFKEKNTDLIGSMTPLVTPKHLEIDLAVQYTSQLRLWIMHKSNTFLVNDNVSFSHYIAKRDLRLLVECKCGTGHETNNLEFQPFNGVIGAVTLESERIALIDKDNIYFLQSDFINERTTATVSKNTFGVKAPLRFDLPLLPKYKLRDRQHLIDKLRTYAIFS